MTRLDYCYDCHQAHWASDCPKRRVAEQATNTVTKQPVLHAHDTIIPDTVTKHCPTCRCGSKRLYQTAAERQKAYRERHKPARDATDSNPHTGAVARKHGL